MTSTDKLPERIWVWSAGPNGISGYYFADKPSNRGPLSEYIRDDLHDALAAENEALRAEVEGLNDQCKRADEIIALGSKTIKQLMEERDQALAQRAAVQIHMRERAAVKCFVDRGRFDTPDRIRALPIDPDAEAALKRVVDAAVMVVWNAAYAAKDGGNDAVLNAVHHAVAIARPPAQAPGGAKDAPDHESIGIPGPANHYGGLLLKREGGQDFWCIENWDGEHWEECAPNVATALRALATEEEQ